MNLADSKILKKKYTLGITLLSENCKNLKKPYIK